MSSNIEATQLTHQPFPTNIVMTNCNNVSSSTCIGVGNDPEFVKRPKPKRSPKMSFRSRGRSSLLDQAKASVAPHVSNEQPNADPSRTAQDEGVNALFAFAENIMSSPAPNPNLRAAAHAQASAANIAYGNMPYATPYYYSIPPWEAGAQAAAAQANPAFANMSSDMQNRTGAHPNGFTSVNSVNINSNNMSNVIVTNSGKTYVNGRLVESTSSSGSRSGGGSRTVISNRVVSGGKCTTTKIRSRQSRKPKVSDTSNICVNGRALPLSELDFLSGSSSSNSESIQEVINIELANLQDFDLGDLQVRVSPRPPSNTPTANTGRADRSADHVRQPTTYQSITPTATTATITDRNTRAPQPSPSARPSGSNEARSYPNDVPPPKYSDVVGNGLGTSHSRTDATPTPRRPPPESKSTTTVPPPVRHATSRNAGIPRSSWTSRLGETLSNLWPRKWRSSIPVNNSFVGKKY
ncbi:hypothetical protein CVT25_009217 [Psilocybe cyanescens]|uniref:Uncharacterized protein n=1 Tax=Psilocybe cyanescens TaxID=93625 RepID=A0A409WWJ7_PSICY|nr:hypothetical protein CVT25_009217 [Psilocybe cyanescens]